MSKQLSVNTNGGVIFAVGGLVCLVACGGNAKDLGEELQQTPVTLSVQSDPPLPPFLHWCDSPPCDASQADLYVCPASTPNCVPSRTTTVKWSLSGRAFAPFFLPLFGNQELAVRAQGNATGSFLPTIYAATVRVHSDIDINLTYSHIAPVWGGTVFLTYENEQRFAAGYETNFVRAPGWDVGPAALNVHSGLAQIIAQEQNIAQVVPSNAHQAFFLPTELAAAGGGEGNFAYGNGIVTINYGNPPWAQYQGGIERLSFWTHSHEYSHELFAQVAGKIDGYSSCLNEGLADAMGNHIGHVPNSDFGPVGVRGIDFAGDCKRVDEVHDVGNCYFWHVKQAGRLTDSFLRGIFHPHRRFNFNSCTPADVQTGNSLLVWFTEAAGGANMTSVLDSMSVPHAGSYDAALAALGFAAPTTQIPIAVQGPVVDGDKDLAWWSAPALAATKTLRGPVAAQTNRSATWTTTWDVQNLYVWVEVQDDVVVTDSSNRWEDDSVELYLDGNNSKGTQYDGANDFQWIFGLANGDVHVGARSAARTTGIQHVVKTWNGGYRMEIAIPWSTIGTNPMPGGLVGIDVHINDDDDGGNREGKLATFATVDDAWDKPSSFGTVALSAAPLFFGDVSIAAMQQAPVIDGTPEALWAAAEILANQKNVERIIRGQVTSSVDASAYFRTGWDAQNFYVLIDVSDDLVRVDGPNPWDDDSVELYIDANNSRGTSYDGVSDFQFVFRPGVGVVAVGSRSAPNTTGIQFATVVHDSGRPNRGYTLEVAIPWQTLGVSPAAASLIGFDVHINDDDDGGARDGKLSWHAPVDDAWTNPSSFGAAFLHP